MCASAHQTPALESSDRPTASHVVGQSEGHAWPDLDTTTGISAHPKGCRSTSAGRCTRSQLERRTAVVSQGQRAHTCSGCGFCRLRRLVRVGRCSRVLPCGIRLLFCPSRGGACVAGRRGAARHVLGSPRPWAARPDRGRHSEHELRPCRRPPDPCARALHSPSRSDRVGDHHRGAEHACRPSCRARKSIPVRTQGASLAAGAQLPRPGNGEVMCRSGWRTSARVAAAPRCLLLG